MKLRIFSLFSLFLISICAVKFIPKPGELVYSFDSSRQSGISIIVTLGRYFTFKIKGNLTTGYGWYVENVSTIRKYVTPLNLNQDNSTNDYYSESGMFGAGGYYYFRFKAIRRGTIYILFSNKQPWDPSTASRYHFKVTIR
jgi:predicted secreted protein